jgi:hypothetical protein
MLSNPSGIKSEINNKKLFENSQKLAQEVGSCTSWKLETTQCPSKGKYINKLQWKFFSRIERMKSCYIKRGGISKLS